MNSSERNGIEGHRDIGDGGSAGIKPIDGDITREGWWGAPAYTPWI